MMEKKNRSSNRWLFVAGLLLTLPAAVFLLVSMAKYAWGWSGAYDALYPFYLRWGVEEDLGWNINLLILFGPVAAFLINLPVFIISSFEQPWREIRISISMSGKWPNVLVTAFSGLVLAILFVYLAGENCNCH